MHRLLSRVRLRAHRWVRELRLLAVLFAVFLVASAHGTAAAQATHPSCTGLLELTQATRQVSQGGRVIDRSTVPVPDLIPRAWRSAAFAISYTINLDACPPDAQPRTLLLFRVGGPYRVTLDGAPLRLLGHDEEATPVYNGRIGGAFAVPASARRIEVTLVAPPNVSGGLVRAVVGPQASVLAGPGQLHQRWQQMTTMLGVVLAMAGVIGLLLAAKRGLDPRISWFALACLVWSVRGQLLQLSGVPIDPFIYEQLNPLLICASAALVAASTLNLTGTMTRRRGILLLCTGIYATLSFMLAVALPGLAGTLRLIAFAAAFVTMVSVVVLLASKKKELGASTMTWLVTGYTAVVLGACHDVLMILGVLPAGWWTLLTPGFGVLLLCHLAVVGIYLLQTLGRAERANHELERVIAARVSELDDSFAARRSLELEHAMHAARSAERERLLRDMHDGLGAQLMTALRGAERGALAPGHFAQSLQESLDELRMLMDTTDMDGYLPAVFAAWRNRWESRLAAAGVTLHWAVDESTDQAHLSGASVLQVMRIMQEAAANVIKHADATHMDVSACVDGLVPAGGEGAGTQASNAVLRVEVVDDGKGIAAAREGSGRGLKNMRYRAGEIGASVTVEPVAGGRGTRMCLTVPLAQDQRTSPRLAASIAASAREEIPSFR